MYRKTGVDHLMQLGTLTKLDFPPEVPTVCDSGKSLAQLNEPARLGNDHLSANVVESLP